MGTVELYDERKEESVGRGRIEKNFSIDVDMSCNVNTGVFDSTGWELSECHFGFELTDDEIDLIIEHIPSVFEKICGVASRIRGEAVRELKKHGDNLQSGGNGWEVLGQENKKTKPKTGFVYLLKLEGQDVVKIGITSKCVDTRVCGIKTNSPHDMDLIGFIEVLDVISVEKELHETFKEARIKREWFSLKVEEAIKGYEKFGDFVLAS